MKFSVVKNFIENILLQIYFFVNDFNKNLFQIFKNVIKINSTDLLLFVDLDNKKVLKSIFSRFRNSIAEIIISDPQKSRELEVFLKRQDYSNITVKNSVPENIPNTFKGDEFNSAIWSGINKHKNPISALNAIKTVLSKTGLFYVIAVDFTVYSSMNPSIKKMFAQKHLKIFNEAEIRNIISTAGLTVTNETSYGYLRVYILSKGGY